MTDRGLDLEEIQVGPEGILVGSAREAQLLRDRDAARLSRDDLKQRRELLARKRTALKAKIAELESDFAAQGQDIERAIQREIAQQAALRSTWTALTAQRQGTRKKGHWARGTG
jgi:circadian clock protein KaiC